MVWNLLISVLIGAIAGFIAGQIVKGKSFGLLINIIVGIIGGFLGGGLFNLFGISSHGFIWSLVASIVGAVVLLLLLSIFQNKHKKQE